MRVLFVDDEQSVLDGLRRSLRRHCKDWELSFATSGEEAVEMMVVEAPDVLVSDMRMPGMDGAQLLQIVQERWPGTVRFLLSGHSDSEAIMRTTLVAHQFLSKPCDGAQLRSTVERASALHRLIEDPDVRRAIGEVGKLPPVPETYQKLTEALACEDVSVEMVGDTVALDPVIAAKLLQLVNSSFFGLSRSVSDVNDAVSFLGLDVVRDLVLTLGAFACADVPDALRPMLSSIAGRSQAVAAVARAIAPAEFRASAYAAGLLLDVGHVVVAAGMPEAFAKISSACSGATHPRDQLEREEIGADHAAIGAYLLSQWGLPHDLTSAVAWHHRPANAGSDTTCLATFLHVADALTEELLESGWHEGSSLNEEHLERLGVAGEIAGWREVAAVTLATEGE